MTDNGKSASFTATVSLPTTGTAPYPAIVGYGGTSPLDSGVLSSEGVATINYNPTAVGAEGHGHSATAQTGAFYSSTAAAARPGC